MRNTWLFFGLACLLNNWIPSNGMRILFLFVITFYYVRHYHIHYVSIIILIIFLIPCFYTSESSIPIAKRLIIREIKSNYVIASNGEQDIVVFGIKDANFKDVIDVKGSYERVDTIHNIRSFHFATWLHRRGIDYQINVKGFRKIEEGSGLRHSLYKRVEGIDDKAKRNWIKTMLFQIHEDDISYFMTSSGMHVSFLITMLQKLLSVFVSTTTSSFISFVGIGLLGNATVFSTTILRILCFRCIQLLFPSYSSTDKLGMSMLFTLALFPYMVYELGFLLPVAFRLTQIFNVRHKHKVITSLGVMIPIQFMYFHACNPIQILFFRFARVFYGILYGCCWLYLVLSFDALLEASMSLQEGFTKMESFGFVLHYTPGYIWLSYWLYLFIKYLSYQNHTSIKLYILMLYVPFAPYFDPFGEVLIIDVGQGDCTLIKLPFHQGVMLIDVMGSLYKNIPEDIIVPVLESKGIQEIDQVIITHSDYDHSGGLKELQKLMPVHKVITEKEVDTTLGGLRIPFVLQDMVGSDENENSIMTYLEVYGINFLFMGDAGNEAEMQLLQTYPNMQVDVLKAGHHGSKTSSSPIFLHQLQPKIALISAGRNNRYGHPSIETLERLRNEDIRPLITSRNGAISIKFCKFFSFYRTADNEFGIIDNR